MGPGVYPGMFEQSILIDHGGSRKSASFAVSLTAQILLAGVLLVAPLFYHEALPVLRLPDRIDVLTDWRLPDAPVQSQSGARSSGLALPNPFRSPIAIRSDDSQSGTVIVDDNIPVLTSGPALPALPIGPAAIPALAGPGPAVSVKPEAAPVVDAPVRVGGDVQLANLLRRVVPVYPQAARQIRVSGTVHLLGIIAKDGTVQRLQVLSGHPLLRQAALDAVRQWVYRPTILNGEPVEVEAPIDVIFMLSQ